MSDRFEDPYRVTTRSPSYISLLGTLCLSPGVFCTPLQPGVEQVDARHVVVSWHDANPVDVYLGRSADATQGTMVRVSANNLDGRVLIQSGETGRPYFLIHDRIDGSMARTAERVLHLDHSSNFRDLGGYPSADGKHVRWGLIYRSAATPLLTAHDIAYIEGLQIDSVFDLRSKEERKLVPIRLKVGGGYSRYFAYDYSFEQLPDTYDELLGLLEPEIREIFHALEHGKRPILIYCTSGQDRTGIVSALLLYALGVDRRSILEDYHLSTISRRPMYEVPTLSAERYRNDEVAAALEGVRKGTPTPLYSTEGVSMLGRLLTHIEARWGSVNGYLDDRLAISAQDIQQLRESYLD